MFVAGAGLKGDGRSGLTALLGCKPKAKKEDDYGFICWVPCLIGPCVAVFIGLVIILGGSAMCTVGYYSEHFSSSQGFNGTHNVTIVNHDKRKSIHILTFLGPVIMGCGCFAIVIACVVVCEARDQNIKAKWENKRKKKEEREAAREAFYDAIMTKIKLSRLRMLQRQKKLIHSSNNNIIKETKWSSKTETIVEEDKEKEFREVQIPNGTTEVRGNYTTEIINETDSGFMSPDSGNTNDNNEVIVHNSRNSSANREHNDQSLSYTTRHIGGHQSITEIENDVNQILDTDEFLDIVQKRLTKQNVADDNLFNAERTLTKTDIFLSEMDDSEEFGDFSTQVSSGDNKKSSQSIQMSAIPEHEDAAFNHNSVSDVCSNSNSDKNQSQSELSGSNESFQEDDSNVQRKFKDTAEDLASASIVTENGGSTLSNTSLPDLDIGKSNMSSAIHNEIEQSRRAQLSVSNSAGSGQSTARSTSHVKLENKKRNSPDSMNSDKDGRPYQTYL